MTVVVHNNSLPGSLITAELVDPNSNDEGSVLAKQSTTAGPTGTWELDLLPNGVANTTYGVSTSYWQITEPSAGGPATVWDVIVPAPAATSIGTPLRLASLSTPTASSVAPAIAAGETVYNVANYGFPTDGVTDGSSNLATILGYGGVTFFPPGVWVAQGISVPAGAHLKGIGSGGYGFTVPSSCIRLAPAANQYLLRFQHGAAHGRIDDLEIDGNAANQTSAGTAGSFGSATSWGLLHWDDYTTGGGEESQWDLFRCYIHDGYADNIYEGNNRRAMTSYKLITKNAGRYGLISYATDSRHVGLICADCADNGIVLNGANYHFNNCDVFKCKIGVLVNSGVSHVSWIGCDADLNNQQGMYINMASAMDVNVIGSFFRNNGQATDATYYNIQIDGNGTGCTIIGGGGATMSSGITNRVINDIHCDSNTIPPNVYGWNPTPSAGLSGSVFSWSTQTFSATGTWGPQQHAITVTAASGYSLALPTVGSCNPDRLYTVIKTDNNANAITITGATQGSVALSSQYAKASFRVINNAWYQVA